MKKMIGWRKINKSDRVGSVGCIYKTGSLLKKEFECAKYIYFHTGTHKTGSTALQVYLATNVDRLRGVGITYDFQPGADKETGNGQLLYEALYDRRMPDQELDDLLSFYLGEKSVSICSSEDFTRFGKNEWMQIQDSAKRLGVTVRTITFVRDIAPYYVSLHGQMLKGGEVFSDIDEFCTRDQYFPVINSLRCMLEIFGRDAMSVIHYETAIDRLDSAFTSVLDVPCELFDRSVLDCNINRSLTSYEQEILTIFNEATGSQYSYEMSSLLMNKRPNLKDVKLVSQNIFNTLFGRHGSDIEWVNTTFFDTLSTLKVSEQLSSNKSVVGPDIHDRQAIDRDVINWAIKKLQSAQDASIEYVTSRLLAIDWHNSGDPRLPEDFDPIAYLLLNRDVLFAGAPPYEHFIVSGKNEQGRKWKWSNL